MPEQLKLFQLSELVAFILCPPKPLFTDSLANTDDLQDTTTSDESYFLFKLMIVEKIDI